MTHIFISYQREESFQLAQSLHSRLQSLGFKTWYDQNDHDFEPRWRARISDEIEKCEAFLIIITRNSYESDWTRFEYEQATTQSKPIVVVLNENAVSPPTLNCYQQVDLTQDYETGFQELRARLQWLLSEQFAALRGRLKLKLREIQHKQSLQPGTLEHAYEQVWGAKPRFAILGRSGLGKTALTQAFLNTGFTTQTPISTPTQVTPKEQAAFASPPSDAHWIDREIFISQTLVTRKQFSSFLTAVYCTPDRAQCKIRQHILQVSLFDSTAFAEYGKGSRDSDLPATMTWIEAILFSSWITHRLNTLLQMKHSRYRVAIMPASVERYREYGESLAQSVRQQILDRAEAGFLESDDTLIRRLVHADHSVSLDVDDSVWEWVAEDDIPFDFYDICEPLWGQRTRDDNCERLEGAICDEPGCDSRLASLIETLKHFTNNARHAVRLVFSLVKLAKEPAGD